MWLEGAVQNVWSVSQMRRKRWETLGALPGDEPSADDIVTAEYDEDVDSAADDVPEPSLSEKIDTVLEPDAERSVVSHPSETEATHSDEESGLTNLGPLSQERETTPEEGPAGVAMRPFEDLPPLPDDLAEVFETCKLGILRHKMDHWVQVSCEDVVRWLQALEHLAVAED